MKTLTPSGTRNTLAASTASSTFSRTLQTHQISAVAIKVASFSSSCSAEWVTLPIFDHCSSRSALASLKNFLRRPCQTSLLLRDRSSLRVVRVAIMCHVSCTPSTQHPATNPDAENHASSSNHRPDNHYPGAQCTKACTPYGHPFILHGGVFLSCPSSSSLDARVSWILLFLALFFWWREEGRGQQANEHGVRGPQ